MTDAQRAVCAIAVLPFAPGAVTKAEGKAAMAGRNLVNAGRDALYPPLNTR